MIFRNLYNRIIFSESAAAAANVFADAIGARLAGKITCEELKRLKELWRSRT